MAFKLPPHKDLGYVSGNIVDDKAEVLVNTVNCRLKSGGRGVMGKGVALAFAQRFPSIMSDYEKAIKSGELTPGRALLFDLPDGRKWAALATKDHYFEPSKREWVEAGLKELGSKLRDGGFKSVAIPPPGCGQGGLAWKDIEPLVHRHLEGVSVSVYGQPSGAMLERRLDRTEAERAVEHAAKRDALVVKPLYGKLAASPEVSHRMINPGSTEVMARMLIEEQAGRKPVTVILQTGALTNDQRFKALADLAKLEAGQEMSLGGKWKRGEGGWQFSAARAATGNVPISQMKSDRPSPSLVGAMDIEAMRSLKEPERAASVAQVQAHAESLDPRGRDQFGSAKERDEYFADVPVAAEASMYFKYGQSARDDLKAQGPGYSTFEAILDGERTSTTRYDRWQGTEKWAGIKEGSNVRFYEEKGNKGRSVIVKVMDVRRIDHRGSDKEALDRWSKAEGWSSEFGAQSARKNGSGIQIRYIPLPGQAVLEGRAADLASVRKRSLDQIQSDADYLDGRNGGTSRKMPETQVERSSKDQRSAPVGLAAALMQGGMER